MLANPKKRLSHLPTNEQGLPHIGPEAEEACGNLHHLLGLCLSSGMATCLSAHSGFT